jgi:hypothetical protein
MWQLVSDAKRILQKQAAEVARRATEHEILINKVSISQLN